MPWLLCCVLYYTDWIECIYAVYKSLSLYIVMLTVYFYSCIMRSYSRHSQSLALHLFIFLYAHYALCSVYLCLCLCMYVFFSFFIVYVFPAVFIHVMPFNFCSFLCRVSNFSALLFALCLCVFISTHRCAALQWIFHF